MSKRSRKTRPATGDRTPEQGRRKGDTIKHFARQIPEEDFEAFLAGDKAASDRIVPMIREFLLVCVRWLGQKPQDQEDLVEIAVCNLLAWRKRATKASDADFSTPADLLAYACQTLENAIRSTARRPSLIHLAEDADETLPRLSAPWHPDEWAWVAARLQRWAVTPPIRTSRPLRRLLTRIASLAQQLGRLPRIADLAEAFGVSEPTASRLCAELAALLRDEADDEAL